MATDLQGFTTQEVLNKVLNTTSSSFKVDIVSGAEYAEDAAHTSEDVGQFVLGVRNDTLGTLGGADGDYVPFQMNASGALYVEISSGGSADAAHVDDAGFTLGTHSGMMMMGFAGTQSVDANDAGAIAMETDGSIHIHDGGNTITVDGTVTANLSATDNAVLDAMVVDLAAMETLLTAANVDHAANEVLLTGIDADTDAIKTDMAAIEVLLTAANVDHAANEALLTTIDADTGAIKTAVELIDNAIDGSQMQVDVVAISAQSDGTYIGDIKFGESLPAGTAAIGKLAANDGVDIGDVDVTSVTTGHAAANLGKREDDAHANQDVGVMALAVRNDDVAAIGAADGDYAPLQVNAAGSLYTTDATGEAGSILVTGTSAVTTGISGTKFIAIQFIEDTVFASSGGLVAASEQLYPDDTGVGSDISSNGAAIDSVTFPQGMTIFGRWNGFTLASGKVIGYIGYV